ncbi:hypothetical protein [Embleya sp. NBC_00896]|uniref:hypothetical protein n=1 Tax=Embleya sp. NBC_00896 TaxID=2975961 RepID=UPI002F90A6BF|nr:hypothetical protein OG928_45670 [Embleya sp. NBC_00896]
MAPLRNLLGRFRPVTAPGPGVAGVPADRSREFADELATPLGLLAASQAEARTIRAQAEHRAAEIRRRGERDAEALVAQARNDSPAEHERSARRVFREAEARAAEIRDSGLRTARAVSQRAEARMPALVGRVLAEVVADLDGTRPTLPGPAAEGRP